MLVIMLNCVTLGMFRPCEDVGCQSERCSILEVGPGAAGAADGLLAVASPWGTGRQDWLSGPVSCQAFDDFIFAFFAVEMIVKMIALGLFGQRCYLGDTWNRLDFFIVMAGYEPLAPSAGAGPGDPRTRSGSYLTKPGREPCPPQGEERGCTRQGSAGTNVGKRLGWGAGAASAGERDTAPQWWGWRDRHRWPVSGEGPQGFPREARGPGLPALAGKVPWRRPVPGP